MDEPWRVDRRLTLAILLAFAVQLAAVAMWAGSAAERLLALEQAQTEVRNANVRLARLETRLEHMDKQLDRIEQRLEPSP